MFNKYAMDRAWIGIECLQVTTINYFCKVNCGKKYAREVQMRNQKKNEFLSTLGQS